MKEWNELLGSHASRTDEPLKPQVVAQHVNDFLSDDAIVVSDCGTVATWAARYVQMKGNRMFSCTGMLATMANGLPYSVGAAVAYPGRQVCCLIGDGGCAKLMGALATRV